MISFQSQNGSLHKEHGLLNFEANLNALFGSRNGAFSVSSAPRNGDSLLRATDGWPVAATWRQPAELCDHESRCSFEEGVWNCYILNEDLKMSIQQTMLNQARFIVSGQENNKLS